MSLALLSSALQRPKAARAHRRSSCSPTKASGCASATPRMLCHASDSYSTSPPSLAGRSTDSQSGSLCSIWRAASVTSHTWNVSVEVATCETTAGAAAPLCSRAHSIPSSLLAALATRLSVLASLAVARALLSCSLRNSATDPLSRSAGGTRTAATSPPNAERATTRTSMGARAAFTSATASVSVMTKGAWVAALALSELGHVLATTLGSKARTRRQAYRIIFICGGSGLFCLPS